MNGVSDAPPSDRTPYEILVERPPGGLLGRVLVTGKHLLGLLAGGGIAYVRGQRESGRQWTIGLLSLQALLAVPWLVMDRELVSKPFAVQFRRRLEMLGPTYIKLGQILALRDDLLPRSLTEELQQHLMDQLPAVPYERLVEIVEADLGRPMGEMFAWVETVPLGSASLAQTHRAELHGGEAVVIKVLKPWVRETVQRDTRLMRLAGALADPVISRFQPKRLVDEFASYTLREVDLRFEADNAETFRANFADWQDIRFPAVYRDESGRDVLCMDYFGGHKPTAAYVAGLSPAERRRVIDRGIGSITRMIFRDGFFHADLHPGNIVLFEDESLGYLDLGMVGRFGADTRKRMLYYFYALVSGHAADAARYLTSLAIAGVGSDPDGFRRAVEDFNRRWLAAPPYRRTSIAQLMLQSVGLAGHHRIQYPGEVVLMAKALVTVEGMARTLDPELDIVDASRDHVRSILFAQFEVARFVRDSVVLLPELIDAMRRGPFVLTDSLRYLEGHFKTQTEHPIAGLRATIFAAACLIAGAIVAATGGQPWLWAALFVTGFSIAIGSWLTGR